MIMIATVWYPKASTEVLLYPRWYQDKAAETIAWFLWGDPGKAQLFHPEDLEHPRDVWRFRRP